MQLSRSYQLANPSLTVEFVEVLFDTSANKGWRPSGSEVIFGALVRGVGKDEYSALGVFVVGGMLPYANAAAVAKAMAMTVSIQIKQVSINDFTHGSLLVDLSLAGQSNLSGLFTLLFLVKQKPPAIPFRLAFSNFPSEPFHVLRCGLHPPRRTDSFCFQLGLTR